MFTLPYFYLYVVSCVLAFALKNTAQKINPANSIILPLMGLIGLLTTLANYALLITAVFVAEHWWYALVMWVVGFVASILVPPTKVETILGYIGAVCAPLCTVLAFLNLCGVI